MNCLLPRSTNKTGTLWVAADHEEMAEVRRKYELYLSAGLARFWTAVRARKQSRTLRRPLAGALQVLGDGLIYSPTAAQFLLHGVAKRGALFTDCNVV